MNTFERSEEFAAWLNGLEDKKGKARILSRLDLASLGNFGDCEPVGEGVSEMRIHYGPGYRVYHMRREANVYMLLNGGDKDTQGRDIKRAKEIAAEVKKEDAKKKKDAQKEQKQAESEKRKLKKR